MIPRGAILPQWSVTPQCVKHLHPPLRTAGTTDFHSYARHALPN